MNEFQPGSYKVLYVYQINDGKHEGRLKVGDATYHTTKTLNEIQEEANANSPLQNHGIQWSTPEIEAAARKRIDEQTKTADVEYTPLWSILAIKPIHGINGELSYVPFRDYEIHAVLKRNNVKNAHGRSDKKVGEWFVTDLQTIKDAVTFVQTGQITGSSTSAPLAEIKLRDEQNKAAAFTASQFKNGTYENPKKILWSAIMRFGKTLTAYKTVKKNDEIKKVLIVTHRPVVADGWFEDFNKIFADDPDVHFASKRWGETWDQVKEKNQFFYFASIQDLRGSFGPVHLRHEDVKSDELKKNSEIFDTNWDMILTDEAHEGTSTLLAETMYENIKAKYWLHLSGTPFNIIEDFEQKHVYKWDYIDEQKARRAWNNDHPLDPNPYDSLPTIEIFTYDISENFKYYKDSSSLGFDFAKFFAVGSETSVGKNNKIYRKFKDEKAVWNLLNLMTRSDDYEDDKREFPFSTVENLDLFKHTFWLLPSVAAAEALEQMLSKHAVFRNYSVVNVTADNFEGDNALATVQRAIKENEKTITLSFGRLTTGVTVPEWTGVFLMSNMQSPMSYMQTIFRVKSGGVLSDGVVKDKGYVFDFSPDRTLTMVAHAAQLTRDSLSERRESVEELLEYLPIISGDGSRFEKFDTDTLMRTLNRVFISKAVNCGFETPLLYTFGSKITAEDVENFMKLQKTIGKQSTTISGKITISESKLSESDKLILDKKKKSENLSDNEHAELTEAEKKEKTDRESRRSIIAILNSVSVRVPLLVFATSPKVQVTVDNLVDLIDDKSWEEFMPKGFTKNGESNSWEYVKKFYDKTIFEGACEEIRERVKLMDDERILDRVPAVAQLFGTFKNPDKETILTSWSVVNRHYADTLGGLRWTDDAAKWYCSDGTSRTLEEIEDLELKLDPIWIDSPKGAEDFWLNQDTTTIDINSKTALYALYAAGSMFYAQKKERERIGKMLSDETLWRLIIENQVFVNCRVPYSRVIAHRVLAGYRNLSSNGSVVDVLDIRRKLNDSKVKKEDQKAVWKWLFNPKNLHKASERANEVLTSENIEEIVTLAKESVEEDDRFTAVVSNPPYHTENNGQKTHVWHHFVSAGNIIADFSSFIHPVGWIKGGLRMKETKESWQSDKNLSLIIYNIDPVFENVGIVDTTITFFKNRQKVEDTILRIKDGSEYSEKSFDWEMTRFISTSLQTQLATLSEKIRPDDESNSMSSIIMGKTHFGIVGGKLFREQNRDLVFPKPDEGLNQVLAEEKVGDIKSDRFYIDLKNAIWGFRNKQDNKYWKVAFPATGDTQWRRTNILPPGCVYTGKYVAVFTNSEEEAKNVAAYVSTDFYHSMMLPLLINHHAMKTTHRNVPKVNFITGEVLNLPGTFLDFSNPQTLDEQLAKIYNLTEDEKDLISKDLRHYR